MARHEPPDVASKFGVAMMLSNIPDALTGGTLLPPSAFGEGKVEDRLVYFMGTDTHGWPVITSEASVVKHLANIRASIEDHVDTSKLKDEVEHRDAILSMAHVRGLVWRFRDYHAILHFGYQHLFKFDPLTWYAELDMQSDKVIPYVQEILVASLLTHTATFMCTAKISRGMNVSVAAGRIAQVAKTRALAAPSDFDHGQLKIYVLPSPSGASSKTVKFEVVLHWVPDMADSDVVGVNLEKEGATLQALQMCQTDANVKGDSLKPSERVFLERIRAGNAVIQKTVGNLLGETEGVASFGVVDEFSVDLDHQNTFYHTSLARDDTFHVHMNSRPRILSDTFYSIGYPSFMLYRITASAEGGMFPSYFAENEATHHVFGAVNKQIASEPV